MDPGALFDKKKTRGRKSRETIHIQLYGLAYEGIMSLLFKGEEQRANGQGNGDREPSLFIYQSEKVHHNKVHEN
jgi:hypothetical protein